MTHEYTAHEALGLILRSLEQVNAVLAERAQFAIDAGIDDVLEQDIIGAKRRRGKAAKREYRKNRPLTDQESIDAVLDVLEAHLVVQRRVVNSALEDFKVSALATVKERSWYETSAKEVVVEVADSDESEKQLLVEMSPESARLTSDQEPTIELKHTSEEDIAELEELIAMVRELTRFGD